MLLSPVMSKIMQMVDSSKCHGSDHFLCLFIDQ